MIIYCPNCESRFSVPDSALGNIGKRLKCSVCSHEWFEFKDDEDVGTVVSKNSYSRTNVQKAYEHKSAERHDIDDIMNIIGDDTAKNNKVGDALEGGASTSDVLAQHNQHAGMDAMPAAEDGAKSAEAASSSNFSSNTNAGNHSDIEQNISSDMEVAESHEAVSVSVESQSVDPDAKDDLILKSDDDRSKITNVMSWDVDHNDSMKSGYSASAIFFKIIWIACVVLMLFFYIIYNRNALLPQSDWWREIYNKIGLHDHSNIKFESIDVVLAGNEKKALNLRVSVRNIAQKEDFIEFIRFVFLDKNKSKTGEHIMPIKRAIKNGGSEIIEGELTDIGNNAVFMIVSIGSNAELKMLKTAYISDFYHHNK